MIADGIVLGTVGIAIVFGFLLLLVFTMYVISAIARRFPDISPGPPNQRQTPHSREAEIAAAVAVAKSRSQSHRARSSV
ncbi:MAG: OadG family transporter subunit [Spirochaetota bacterium]